MVCSKRIPFFRVGRSIRFDPNKIEKWLREGESPVENWDEKIKDWI
jgi:hypothetical protein